MKTGNRGSIEVGVVYLLAGVAAGVFLGNWNPFYKLLGKEPPTKELAAVRAELEQTKTEAATTQAALAEANAQERADLEEQIQSAQGDALGAQEAIKRVPPEHRTAEVKLAAAMTQRVSLKLAKAIGTLPVDQQEAMVLLIDQALSEKQAEVDEAYRKLAERDREFAVITKERDVLVKTTIPKLSQELETINEKKATLEAKVDEVTNKVSEWADKKAASDAEAHSLRGSLDRLWFYIKVGVALAVGGYVFVAFFLPGLIKHMGNGRLKNLLRDISGNFTNPFLYNDAKAKLNSLKAAPHEQPATAIRPDS